MKSDDNAPPIADRAIDLPAMLRRAADMIESGEYGDIKGIAAVCIGYNSQIDVDLWGEISVIEACGAFCVAPSLIYLTEHEDN